MSDMISRQAAKEAIREKFKDLRSRCEINEVLNSLPSVQQEQQEPDLQPIADSSCVRRWDAIYGIMSHTFETDGMTNPDSVRCYGKGLNTALKVIKDLPSVQPEEQEAQAVLSDRQCEIRPFEWERRGFCPRCHQVVKWELNRAYCGFCGKRVKWNG